MPRRNVDFLAFNRGLISTKALARIDVDRTSLSAETFVNWIPKTQGAMRIRPGTKYLGSSRNDSGAYWIPFVAATDDTALIELTDVAARFWISDALLTRNTHHSGFGDVLADTGLWTSGSSGGGTMTFSQSGSDTGLVLDAVNRGGVAKATRKITTHASDAGTELALKINVSRGPLTFRIGTDTGTDDIFAETTLRTGRHNIAFTAPAAGYCVTFTNTSDVDRILQEFTLADTGTLVMTAPWDAADLSKIRYSQSADVVFVAAAGYQQYQLERRDPGGRSWSIVKYQPTDGPFVGKTADGVQLKAAATFGNTTLTASSSFFNSNMVGSLFWLFHNSYNWTFNLAADDTYTDPITITGVAGLQNEGVINEFEFNDREWDYIVSGVWVGTIRVYRSTDEKDVGPYADSRTSDADDTHGRTDTGTDTFSDRSGAEVNNNVTEYAKIGFGPGDYTSGAATVKMNYKGGSEFGLCRVTGYTSPTVVNVEILKAPANTNYTSDWQEGSWSDNQTWPTAVSLHEGRLWWFGGSDLWGSVADDYSSFSTEMTGDGRPISRTFGEGPVDSTAFSLSLSRLIIGTAGGIMTVKSSSFDEPLTADNMSVKMITNHGAAASLRAIPYNNRGLYVDRSTMRVFEVAFSVETGDYFAKELSVLNPDILLPGVVDIGIQINPDTRIHFVLADGTVAIFSYEPDQELLCWSKFQTDTGSASNVERVVILPAVGEDAVYYHTKRQINGATKRFLERWATETESLGDTGLSWIADCAISRTSASSATVTGLSHLEGQKVIAWTHDTGTGGGKDQSPDDTGGAIHQYTVASSQITLTEASTHAVVGLPYVADWKSTKLAYVAGAGTPLTQMKRTDHIGFVLENAHNNGLFFGRDFTNMDALPRVADEGAEVDADKIFSFFDQVSMAFPGLFNSDSRICLRGKAPRPMTVLAAVPNIDTNDKV